MSMNERWPKAVEDGMVPTDNAMGIMTEEPAAYCVEEEA